MIKGYIKYNIIIVQALAQKLWPAKYYIFSSSDVVVVDVTAVAAVSESW